MRRWLRFIEVFIYGLQELSLDIWVVKCFLNCTTYVGNFTFMPKRKKQLRIYHSR